MIPGLSNRQLLCRHDFFVREDDPSVLMLDLDQAQPRAGADRLGRVMRSYDVWHRSPCRMPRVPIWRAGYWNDGPEGISADQIR